MNNQNTGLKPKTQNPPLVFEYQKFNRYFAQVAGTLEEICEEELRELGAKDTKIVYRGIRFQADHETLYRINYQSRLTTRVLAQLLTFACHSPKYLKKTATNIAWEEILSLDTTFAITASVSDSAITHSLYAALCLKDGIADYFNAKYGKRPNVDTENPDVRLNLHIDKNKAVISLDTSGESLHKRGYRVSGHEAPMQETLAAALVRLSGWNGDNPLWDPMCGSGTILCEALMKYCGIPAQYLRKKFGFFRLPDFDKAVWDKVKKRADEGMRPLPKGLIRGSDKSQKAIESARENLSALPYHDVVKLTLAPFTSGPVFENGTIITNPPYGIRIGTKENVTQLYKEFGDYLKKKCNGTSAYVLIGDTSLRKAFGLKPLKRIPLVNGSIPCELLRIDSYRIAFRKPVEDTAGSGEGAPGEKS